MRYLLAIVNVLILISVSYGNKLPKVKIPFADVEGTTEKSLNGRLFYTFEGIPYAKPPVGKRRFQPPDEIKTWQGRIKADTIYKCIQYNHFTPPGGDFVIGDEDCLYVNIYTPTLNQNAQLDVIVYIHGGAFMFNWGALQKPHYLMDRNVISVTLNYRLGPLGFLSTENAVVPGNNGMRDQILALKWIKKYIKYFGGNPNSMTIFGMSAGGASIHLHQLMPQSKGLFEKAVSQSGCALNPWVLMEKPLEKTKKIADLVGCNFEDIQQIIDCLKQRPARQIVGTIKQFQRFLYNPFSPFGVVIDSWSSDPVLPEHPYQLLKKGQVNDVPWIASMTSSEGLYPASDFYFDHHLEDINSRWNELMPFLLDYNYTVDISQHNSVSQKIKEYYLNNEKVTKTNFAQFVQIFSDRLFLHGLDVASRIQASVNKNPVYSYYFDYRGSHSLSEDMARTLENIGVSHADDTGYTFNTTWMDTTTNQQDKNMINLFLDLFTEFAKTGKPKAPVEWKPLSKNIKDDISYLHIKSPEDVTLEFGEIFKHRKFWKSLPIKENEKLFNAKDEL